MRLRMALIVGTPMDWPQFLRNTIHDVPHCWTLDDNNVASSSTKKNNLYVALVHSQKEVTYLERVIQQNDQDLGPLMSTR